MCPAGFINGADGSSACPQRIPPGTDLAERYAVIVSFGVFFNGTALDEIASRVGVQASPYEVLSTLVKCVPRARPEPLAQCLPKGNAHVPLPSAETPSKLRIVGAMNWHRCEKECREPEPPMEYHWVYIACRGP